MIAQAIKGRRHAPVVDARSGGGLVAPVQSPVWVDERYPGQQRVTGRYGTPLLDPIEAPPLVDSSIEAGEMLALALLDIPTGRADRAFLASAECYWPPTQIAVLASLIARARIAGPAGGVR